MMSRVKKGMVAGFAATVVVSLLEAINLLAGQWFTPFPGMIAGLLGLPGNLLVGWIAHFVIGTLVLGGLFGMLCPRLPTDTPGTKGIAFAVTAFMVLMVGVFLFDPRLLSGANGFQTIAWMLVTNVVFGFVMGTTYARLVAREKRMAREMASGIPAH